MTLRLRELVCKPLSNIRRWVRRLWFERLPDFLRAQQRKVTSRRTTRLFGRGSLELEPLESKEMPGDPLGLTATPILGAGSSLIGVGNLGATASVTPVAASSPPVNQAPTSPGASPAPPTVAFATTPTSTPTGAPEAAPTAPAPQGQASGDPFANPLADWLGGVDGLLGGTKQKPSGLSGEGGGGGGGGGGATAPIFPDNPSAAGPTPQLPGAAAGDDLWRSANTLSGDPGAAANPTTGPTTPTGTGIAATPTSATNTASSVPASSPASTLNGPANGDNGAGATQDAGGQPGGPRYTTPFLLQNYGKTALPFEVNSGQTDPSVHFLSHGPGFGLFVTDDGAMLSLVPPGQPNTRAVLQLHLDGANPHPSVLTEDPLTGRSNYFTGTKSLTNVAQYGRVVLQDVYPGVDLAFHGTAGRQVEYDFEVRPGGDVGQVHLTWRGATGLSVDAQGALHVRTGAADLIEDAPILYQQDGDSRTPVTGRHVLLGNNQIGFAADGYDHSKPLVVDPVLSFSTYLGGSGNDYGYAIAVGNDGSAYITGKTASNNFPNQPGIIEPAGPNGATDAFVTKLDPTGTTIVYSTYLGGSGDDQGNGIVVKSDGTAYVTGLASPSFPTTSGAYETVGGNSAFVTRLSATGDALLYSTYVSLADSGAAIALDQVGFAYGVGSHYNASSHYEDLEVFGLDPNGHTLPYTHTVAGTAGDINGRGIAVDQNRNLYVTGDTGDASFSTTTGVVQTSLGGGKDAFALKLTGGSTVAYATFLGGLSDDSGKAIAVGQDGSAYVVGDTSSINFPVTSWSVQLNLNSPPNIGTDAFVTRLSADATTLTYSTYLGGTSNDGARAVAVDPQGYATVAGYTKSSNFPTNNALNNSGGGGLSGTQDAFVARLNPAGTTLAYSTYLGGGGGINEANGVALDLLGNAYVTGDTNSASFPTANAMQSSNAGGYDAFVAKIALRPAPPVFTAISPDTGSSSIDFITSNQNLILKGTAAPQAVVDLWRRGGGELGTVAADPTTGSWSFDFSGTTLPEGVSAFYGTQAVNGQLSDPSADFLVTVDRTAPTVTLTVPATTTSLAPTVVAAVSDLGGVAGNATVSFDVDTNADGTFNDPGESGYATGTLHDGWVAVTLPALAGTGSYPIRARVTDLAGNQATTGSQTITVTSSGSAFTTTGQVLNSDPLDGQSQTQLGNVQLMQALDLDQSPGTQQGSSPSLVYNSGSVSQQPIVQATIQTDNGQALPAHVIAQLTWNGGAAQGATTFSTSGFSPGDVLTVAQQVNSAVTTTGRYTWSLQLTLDYGTPVVRTVSGYTFVDAQDSSPNAAGWTLSSVDQLVSIGADTINNYPAGQLRLFGTGGYRFYAQHGSSTTTFDSPANDNGTLSFNGTNYYYTTPAGDTTTFNAAGYETKWTSADGNETLGYTYNGSNQLTGVSAIDGALATFAYSGGLLNTITATNGVVTLTYSGSDVAAITNPDSGDHSFTFDGNHHLTSDTFGSTQNQWAYASGALHTFTWGSTTGTGGVTNTNRTVVNPAGVQGLNALTAATVQGSVRATITDGLGHVTTSELDGSGRAVQQWAADGTRTQLTRDASGRVLTATDPLNRTTTYTRDAAGYVLTQTNPDGTVATFAYQSAFHALTTYTDERGNTTTSSYDASGHKLTDTSALGQTTSYSYQNNGLLRTVTDPANHTTTYGYDGQRRLTTQTDALNHTTSYSYDSTGNPLTTTDPLGRVTTSLYDVMGRLTVLIDPQGHRATSTYDAAGNLLTSTDANDTQTSQIYDNFQTGLVAETINAAGTAVQHDTLSSFDAAGQPTQARNPNGWWSAAQFDALGRDVASTDPNGGTAKTGYDGAGQAVASLDQLGRLSQSAFDKQGRITTSTDALGNVTTSAYDAAGNLTAVTDPLGHTTTTLYDNFNRPTVVIDALGDRTTTTYDTAGNVSTLTDALGHTTSYAYDAANRRTLVTDAVGTSLQRTTTTVYDANGNVLAVTDVLGHTTSYGYDSLNRKITVTDALGNTTTTAYDNAGNVTTVTDARGLTNTYSYDALNRNIVATDAAGKTSTSIYDAVGNNVSTIDPLGNTPLTVPDALDRTKLTADPQKAVAQTYYDAASENTGGSDELGNREAAVNDALGRVIAQADALGDVTSYGYDAAGNRTLVIDPRNNRTTYGYDALNRLMKTTDAAGGTLTVLYDAAGNKLADIDQRGNRTSYSYDALNRLVQSQDALGNYATTVYDLGDKVIATVDALGHRATTAYDADNRPTQVTDALGDLTTTLYDAAGNKTAEIDARGNRTSYAYDANERLTATTDALGNVSTVIYDSDGNTLADVNPRGFRTTYSYDANNRRTQTQDALGDLSTVVYDAAGNEIATVDARGSRTTMTYDALNRVTQTKDALGNTSSVVFDAAGNKLANMDPRGNSTTYSYDGLNRLIQTQDALGNLSSVVYDAAGNQLATVDARGNRTSYAHDALNRATQTTDALGDLSTVGYDAAGNQTVSIDARGNRTSMTYDALNRLTQTKDALGNLSSVVYDAAGNKLAEVDARGNRTSYSYDNLNRISQTTDALGDISTVLYDAAGNQLATIDARGNRTTVAYDALNRPTQTTDVLSDLSTVVYDAVGNKTVDIDARGNRTSMTFDALNRVTQTKDALGDLSSVAYDAAGNQTVTIDARGYRTTVAYDALNRPTQTTDALGNLTSVIYDAAGNRLATIDPRGNRTSYAFDALNRVSQTTDALGDLSTVGYDAAGNQTVSIDARGNRTSMTYDALNRLSQTKDALGNLSTVVFDAAGNKTVDIDARGNRTSMAYDAINRLIQTTDAAGGLSSVVYDAAGNKLADVDARGNRTSYSYDALNRVSQTTDAIGDLSTVLYDAAGNRLATVDPRGNRTSYAYDALNRGTQTTDALGDLSTVVFDAAGNKTVDIDARGNRTTVAYDALNRPTQTTDALGNLTSVIYDAAGNQLATVDARGNRTSMAYDALNRPTQTTDALGDLSTVLYDAAGNQTVSIDVRGNRTTMAYDALNRPTQTTDALGNLTTVLYDAAGNKLATVDPLNHRTSYAYDALNRATQTQDALGNFSTVGYDAAGNQTLSIDARGNRTTFAYDALNRRNYTIDALNEVNTVIFDAASNQIGIYNARGYRTTTTYDALNRAVAVTDANNHIVTTQYDANGNATVTIDALAKRTTVAYDALNRKTTVTAADGGVTSTIYDAVGNVTNSIDPLGHKTTYVYDALNRKTKDIDPLSGTTTYLFDAAGNLTGLIDPVGNRSTFVFDALNRQTQETDPLNKSMTVAYDAAGRQTSSTDRLSRTKTDTYDADNRKLTESWVRSGSTTNVQTYTYDANGNQLTAQDYNGAYTMAYDGLNRATVVNEPFSLTLTYTYDADGNRLQVQDSKGGITTSIYDGTDRLTSRQFTDGTTPVRMDWTYTARDQIQNLTRFSDLAGTQVVGTTAYSYDDVGRTTNILSTDKFAATIANYTTSYDIAGRVTVETDNGTPVTFSYDNTNQLTGDGTNNYSYDANGNRTMTGYTVGAGNRITNDGTDTYTYDDEGNRTKKSKGASAETWSYGYDGGNRLTSLVERAADSPTATLLFSAVYTYDVFDRGIAEDRWTPTTGTITTHYGMDGLSGDNVWVDLTSGNALAVRYLRPDGADALGARVSAAGTTAWYMTDRQGTVKALTDATGVVSDTYTYDGVGATLTESSPSFGDRWRYAGGAYDSTTKQSNFLHRWYDTSTSRWINEDPDRFRAGDTSLGRYAHNSPTNFTDPTGLEPRESRRNALGMAFDYLRDRNRDGEDVITLESWTGSRGRGDAQDFYRISGGAETITFDQWLKYHQTKSDPGRDDFIEIDAILPGLIPDANNLWDGRHLLAGHLKYGPANIPQIQDSANPTRGRGQPVIREGVSATPALYYDNEKQRWYALKYDGRRVYDHKLPPGRYYVDGDPLKPKDVWVVTEVGYRPWERLDNPLSDTVAPKDIAYAEHALALFQQGVQQGRYGNLKKDASDLHRPLDSDSRPIPLTWWTLIDLGPDPNWKGQRIVAEIISENHFRSDAISQKVSESRTLYAKTVHIYRMGGPISSMFKNPETIYNKTKELYDGREWVKFLGRVIAIGEYIPVVKTAIKIDDIIQKGRRNQSVTWVDYGDVVVSFADDVLTVSGPLLKSAEYTAKGIRIVTIGTKTEKGAKGATVAAEAAIAADKALAEYTGKEIGSFLEKGIQFGGGNVGWKSGTKLDPIQLAELKDALAKRLLPKDFTNWRTITVKGGRPQLGVQTIDFKLTFVIELPEGNITDVMLVEEMYHLKQVQKLFGTPEELLQFSKSAQRASAEFDKGTQSVLEWAREKKQHRHDLVNYYKQLEHEAEAKTYVTDWIKEHYPDDATQKLHLREYRKSADLYEVRRSQAREVLKTLDIEVKD
jgi:RHS repeat-associated protein